jgi:squalene-hopene/tetraprenyl-beta-curcumene cyclase
MGILQVKLGPARGCPVVSHRKGLSHMTRRDALLRISGLITAVFFGSLLASRGSASIEAPAASGPAWNAAAAAGYLDKRQAWWMSWPPAAREGGTACVSCHTALSYALGRPALRRAIGEQAPSAVERAMLDSISKRVTHWAEFQPFYTDAKDGPPKSAESRGTEAVLNALILANYDAERGKLRDTARTALDLMWSLQLKAGERKGAWDWLNFHNSPWEANGSEYWGATLAAIAAGTAPDNYTSEPRIQDNLKSLREYLRGSYQSQSLFNRTVLLWASAKLPGLLTTEQRQDLTGVLYNLQQPDGGWSLSAMVKWQRRDGTQLETRSDGYATGLALFALEKAGIAPGEPQIKKGLDWLAQNQDRTEGLWRAYSLNKQRDLNTDIGRFMSDAATAYAVMALAQAH